MIQALNAIAEGISLTREHAARVMGLVVGGSAAPEQVGALLVALRVKVESVDEILGFLDCLRAQAIHIFHHRPDLMDVCGTGGDSAATFNVSTAVAFVVTAAGQPVAKHGNRSISSRAGSFDVLEALGLSFDADPVRVVRSIDEHGIGLFFAPAFHPCLNAVASIRKSLGIYTVFNALGPLLNPAQVKRQLVGVYSPLLLDKTARVLQAQGAEEVMVVRGEDGLDEISLSAATQVTHLKNGEIKQYRLAPEDCGLMRAAPGHLKGGDAQENARILIDIFKGEKGPKRDIVLLNAAAALQVGGKARDIKEGVERAAAAIDGGHVLQLIKKMGARV